MVIFDKQRKRISANTKTSSSFLIFRQYIFKFSRKLYLTISIYTPLPPLNKKGGKRSHKNLLQYLNVIKLLIEMVRCLESTFYVCFIVVL